MFGLPDLQFEHTVWLPRSTWKSNILNPKPEREFLLNLYFGKPDNEDSHKKIFYSAYLGAKAGFFSGIIAVCANSGAGNKNPVVSAKILAGHTLLIGGGVLTYGTVATLVGSIRGKDDPLNHVIAGASVGLIPTYYLRSATRGCVWAAHLMVVGYFLKAYYMSEVEKGEVPAKTPYFQGFHRNTGRSYFWSRDLRWADGSKPEHVRRYNAHNTTTRSERYNY